MSEPATEHEYLLISRGQWDREASKQDIETAIGKFYAWHEKLVKAGRFKSGSRLGTEGAVVSRSGILMDGPFGESKEVVGGYWFVNASSLREAAEIMSENPCLQYGVYFEIRPLEASRASVYNVTNETPNS